MKRVLEVGGLAAVILLSSVAGYCLEQVALLPASRAVLSTRVLSTIVVFIAGVCGILLAVERLNRRR